MEEENMMAVDMTSMQSTEGYIMVNVKSDSSHGSAHGATSVQLDDDTSSEESVNLDPEAAIQNKASWFSCYVNLTNTIMGAGMLGLPYAFTKTGWVLGTVLLFTSAFFAVSSLHLLSLSCVRAPKPWSYFSVANASVPNLTLLIDFSVLLKCFGTATSYLIVTGDMMSEVMHYLGASGSLQSRETWIIICFLLLTPLSFLPSIDALRYTSSAAIMFIFFVVVLVAGYAMGFEMADPCSHINADTVCVGDKMWSDVPIESIGALSIFVFGFTGHENTFAVINELRNPTQDRIDSVFMCSIATTFLVYGTVAMCGYATYGNNIEPDILINYPSNGLTNLGRFFVTLLAVFSYPLQCNPGRKCVMNMVKGQLNGGKEPSTNSYWLRYYLVTILFLGSSFAIAMSVSDLGILLEVVGATGCTLVSYVLPGLIFVVMHHNLGSNRWEYGVAMVTLIVGILMIPIGLSYMYFIEQAL